MTSARSLLFYAAILASCQGCGDGGVAATDAAPLADHGVNLDLAAGPDAAVDLAPPSRDAAPDAAAPPCGDGGCGANEVCVHLCSHGADAGPGIGRCVVNPCPGAPSCQCWSVETDPCKPSACGGVIGNQLYCSCF